MIYEVRARFFFDNQDEALDFYNDCNNALPKATAVNPGQPNQECSQADLVLCNHDGHPPEACNLNQHIDNCPDSPSTNEP